MKERKEIKKKKNKPQLVVTPEHRLCTLYPQLQNLRRFAQNSSMIKRHENDMLFTLFWYGILERAGGGFPNIWIVWSGKHIKKCHGFMHNQVFLSMCLSLRLVFYMLNGLGLIICQAKQLYHNFWPCRNSKVLFLWKNGYKFTRPHFPIAFSLAGFY